MKNAILRFFKGIVFGIANIIPGVSGGSIAVVLKLFDQKKSVKSLLPLIVGAIIGILGFAFLIIGFTFSLGEFSFTFSLGDFPFWVNIFFVGLIAGSIPMIVNRANKFDFKLSYFVPLVIAFLVVVLLAIFHQSSAMGEMEALRVAGSNVVTSPTGIMGYLSLFGVGLLSAVAMLVPGVNTLVALIAPGSYHQILSSIGGLISFSNLSSSALTLLPIVLGLIVGLVAIGIVIGVLIKKFYSYFYYTVLGLMVGSIFATVFIPATYYNWNTGELIYFNEIGGSPVLGLSIAVVLFAVGAVLAYFLGKRGEVKNPGVFEYDSESEDAPEIVSGEAAEVDVSEGIAD